MWLGAFSHISADHFREHFEEATVGHVAEGTQLDVTESDGHLVVESGRGHGHRSPDPARRRCSSATSSGGPMTHRDLPSVDLTDNVAVVTHHRGPRPRPGLPLPGHIAGGATPQRR